MKSTGADSRLDISVIQSRGLNKHQRYVITPEREVHLKPHTENSGSVWNSSAEMCLAEDVAVNEDYKMNMSH